jgi:hypothetical protein
LPCIRKRRGDTKLFCKHIDRSQGEDREASSRCTLLRVHHPIKNLIDCAVATGRDQCTESFLDRCAGQHAGVAWALRWPQRDFARDRLQLRPKGRCFLSLRGWVKNDARSGE